MRLTVLPSPATASNAMPRSQPGAGDHHGHWPETSPGDSQLLRQPERTGAASIDDIKRARAERMPWPKRFMQHHMNRDGTCRLTCPTCSRSRVILILVIVFVYYLVNLTDHGHFLAAIIFALASATDWLDGYLARKFNQMTPLGAFLIRSQSGDRRGRPGHAG